MKITLAEKNHNNKMVRIYIDDSYSFTIPVEDYIRNNLYEEVEIDEQKRLPDSSSGIPRYCSKDYGGVK